jgi:DnaK suppressor protein
MTFENYREKLEKLKAETLKAIERSNDAGKPVELDQTLQGRLSRMDAMQQQEMALAAKRRNEQLLIAIEQAFRRIDTGDYGFCIKCGEEIVQRRLELNPVVLTCINCAEQA